MIPAEFAPLANHLWQSTVFAAVAGLLTLVVRRNQARVRFWLWLAASYKFLLPFTWLVSIGHLFEWRAAATNMPRALSAVKDAVGSPILLTALPATKAISNHSPLLLLLICSIWGCGFVVIAAGWIRELLRIRAVVRGASALSLDLPIRVVSTLMPIEPGVFGILSPVLLLPEGITARLTQAQIEAVLAHELCHVRRRDNLTSAVHMLVEALFWFHPLVWWIGARLIDERERACDEEVLQTGSQAQVYAESILKVCEFYLESPLKCMSGVTGSDLKERIRRIMKNHFGVALSLRKKVLLLTVAATALTAPVVAGIITSPRLQTQSSASSQGAPKFEILSIRMHESNVRPDNPGSLSYSEGIWRANNVSLRTLMAIESQRLFTYGRLIFDPPAWIDSERFEIAIKTDGKPGTEQTSLIVQSLLKDRFNLTMHHETRQLPVYALEVLNPGKFGPRLTPHSEEAKCSVAPLRQPGPGDPMPAYCEGLFMAPRPGDLRETGNKISMELLSEFWSQSVDGMVVDRTGLIGVYDFSFEFAPDQGPGSQASAITSQAQTFAVPSIFTAAQEQLGLKLEPQTAPLDVLVIDHVEEPSPN